MHFITQSEFLPRHTAIIMDGNGRWAQARGWPRIAGHHAGSQAVRRAVEAAPENGIRVLTLYAFSSDNWKRPRAETDALMLLLADHLRTEAARCVAEGVRMSLIGRRDRLPECVLDAALFTEQATAAGTRLHVRLAVDYSAREAIASAARSASGPHNLSQIMGDDVDLLIRTGGERRLSDFLLWECAYAELVFTSRMWPEFDAGDLQAAVGEFRARQRRFGGLDPAGVGQSFIHTPVPYVQHDVQQEAGNLSIVRGDRWLR